MPHFSYRIAFTEDSSNPIKGSLELDESTAYGLRSGGSAYYRTGQILLEGGAGLELVLYHNASTSEFMYMRDGPINPNLLEIVGLAPEKIRPNQHLLLPGQLCLGSERSKLIRQAMHEIFEAPTLDPIIMDHCQQNLAVFPIAREGLKYQVAEAIFENYGCYCDEIVLDAHHVFDSSVPVYNRKVEMTIFKDKDLDRQQRENISVAFIADSIASGLVMKEVIARVKERFEHLQHVEVVAPLATIRGLCQIARSEYVGKTRIRVHVFETLLNALPPDYYYSAHFNIPELHIRPDLDQEYRAWWGRDSHGNLIADTACAGYGWSEVFYSPRKQIQMMNGQLEARHQMTIADIVQRNMEC